jgi:hypothetical protein
MCYILPMHPNTHETLVSEEQRGPGSERSFVVALTAALLILSVVNWWHNGRLWPSLVVISAISAVLGWYRPTLFKSFNWAWFKFGLFLHAIVSPLVMGIMFYGAVTPMALVMRAKGKDLLRLKRCNNRNSYWIARQPPGPNPQSFKDQF